MNVTISYMKEEHLDEVSAIEAQSFSTPWSRQAFADSIAADNYCYLVATACPENGDHVLGYAGAVISFEDADVTNIAVSSEYKRLGIGEKLMEGLCLACKKRGALFIHLEVRVSNTPARNLYTKLGFTEDGIRKNFYSKPTEDAILMTKKIEV